MIIDDDGESARRRLILGLLGASLVLTAMLLGLVWLRAHCEDCDPATVADETTTTVPTTVATTTTTVTSTTVPAPSTSVPPLTVGEYCVTGVASSEALNVRSGPGETNPVIGTFPFDATGILGTGEAEEDERARLWYEVLFEGAFTGRAWVASWLLVEAPCGPYVAFDVVVSDNGLEIEFDPGEWNPSDQPLACGGDDACFVNRDTDDRRSLALAPDAAVYLVGRDLGDVGPLSPAEFADYLAGGGYDSILHLYEPSYPCTTTCATSPRYGQPYHLLVENGVVVRIEQVYTP
ncbi:MAG: SH3 domain-containing protein [Acidimicrobiia bacterium]|nr:SH3 domain-containing protein [Acidimicrobiia bacterium]